MQRRSRHGPHGDSDAKDLAPIAVHAWAGAPDGTTATLSVDDAAAPHVHLFIQRGGALTYFDQTMDAIQTDELRAGATLAIEATDIVRDSSMWDGYATITLTIGAKTDAVKLRVAPVLTEHHLSTENRVFVTSFESDPGSVALRQTLDDGINQVETDGGADASGSLVYEISGDETIGGNAIYADQWAQDFFEVGYMSMPSAGGMQHVIDVYYRSANVQGSDPNDPLRTAGKVVFTKFRGPDAAGVQAFDFNHDPSMDSLNSFGNLETIPPYTLAGTSYPVGRVFRGSVASLHPDPVFEKMIESQAVQPPVYIDTSWLYVGHVDETISFIKAKSPRGWAVLVNDAALAKQMLQDQVTAGNGAVQMFAGENWIDNNNVETPAAISISDVLADTSVMSESQSSAAHVDSQIATLKKEAGLDDTEIIHIPYLHEPVQGLSLAYMPGTVNGLYFKDNAFAAPDPHGPVINGKDIFKDQMETALAPLGISVVWVEDWDLYHRLAGEVHCGTNSRRDVGDATWWTSGY